MKKLNIDLTLGEVAAAECFLGLAHQLGVGVKRSNRLAVLFFRRAALKGEITAYYNLGQCYVEGKGVPRSPSRALYWLGKAAEAKDSHAATDAGVVAENSGRDPVKWYALAHKLGDPLGAFNLARCYHFGIGTKANARKAAALFRASVQGCKKRLLPEDKNAIGKCYWNGWGVERNRKTAAHWYRKSAQTGDSGAASLLRDAIRQGHKP